ncbi:MAG TPA: hypothetical protein VGR08_13150 [Thermomicrobiales bacterium]|nr:hypothetical protein [Thermomicrobiales bacterium]
MTNVHMIVGTLVVLGYALSTILNVRLAFTGRDVSWQRQVSFGSATLLLLQWMLGFSLLGEGRNIAAIHFVLALTAILPVGVEHGYASTRERPRQRGTIAFVANLVTLVIVLIVYIIGQSN